MTLPTNTKLNFNSGVLYSNASSIKEKIEKIILVNTHQRGVGVNLWLGIGGMECRILPVDFYISTGGLFILDGPIYLSPGSYIRGSATEIGAIDVCLVG